MPPNQGPFYHVYREWSETGHSRNIRLIVDALLRHYGDFNPLKNPFPSTIQALARCLSSKVAVATLKDRQQCDANTRRVSARSLENDYQEGALGMLPEGTGVNALQVHGASPLCQQQLQDACGILSQNPRSSNSHFRPVVCDDVFPAVVPAVNADGVDNVNVAAGPAFPHVNGADAANVANQTRSPFLQSTSVPLNAAAVAAGGGGAIYCPLANKILPAHLGEAGAANNMAAARLQQPQQHLIVNAAVAGVDGVVYLEEVWADLVRCPRNCNNIEAIDGINLAMLQATRMISLAIERAQPPTASAATAAPGLNTADVIASLYTRLASARAANRMDAVFCYKRMIDRLERKEEDDLEACFN
jgi:hypothetical protein